MANSLYDNEDFFTQYKQIRDNPNSYNNLLEMPALLSMLPDVSGKNVVDLGCGFGEICRELANRRASYVAGVDMSANMLSVARRRTDSDIITYIESDMCKYMPGSASVDLVTSSLAFHYVEDFNSLVRNIAQVLKKGGVLLFSQEHPLVTAPLDYPDYYLDGWGRPSHYLLNGYGIPGLRRSKWLTDDFTTYHRSIAEICNTLVGHGLSITEVCEPVPTSEAVERNNSLVKEFIKPTFIIIKCVCI